MGVREVVVDFGVIFMLSACCWLIRLLGFGGDVIVRPHPGERTRDPAQLFSQQVVGGRFVLD